MPGFDSRITSLSAAKKRLLDLRLDATKVAPVIERREGQKVRPLSFSQRRLWFAQQLETNSSAYNIHGAVRLIGKLDVGSLQRSLEEIVRRHEVLRTRFAIEKGEAVQVIEPVREFSMVMMDLSALSSEEREQQILELAAQEADTPFNLESDQLIRAKLVCLTPDEHLLLVTMHHIISDGWSVGVLVRELRALYEAYGDGRKAELPELPIQYGDFAEWQHQHVSVLNMQLHYWCERLSGELPVLALPIKRARAAVRNFRGGQCLFHLGRELTEDLRELGRECGATLFMVLAAAYAVLLARHTNQEDLLVGTPIANRTRAETEDLIGCFVNTLVLRINAAGNPSFTELLKRVKQTALEAYAHQDVPFEKVVEELEVNRDASHTPIFQTMLVLQNLAIPELQLGCLRTAPVKFDREIAKYDLTVSLGETGEGLAGLAQFNRELFERDMIEALVAHWQQLLASIVKNPRSPIGQYQILTAPEVKLLEEWNRTESAYERDKTVIELFREQVKTNPKSVAVKSEEGSLTYEELDTLSNRLAHCLRNRGINNEELVGVAMKRSVEMLIAILGTMKAGGAYVALDPESPRERLHFLLEDTGVKVVLTQQRWRERLVGNRDVLCLDEKLSEIDEQSSADLDIKPRPHDLAYVLYTSGSTGQPKGVMVEHRSLLNYVTAVSQHYNLPACRNFAMVQPLTVDSIVTVLYPSLLTGGCLHMISESCAADGKTIAEYFHKNEIDCLKIAPPHLAILHAGSSHDPVMPRKLLIIGGEKSRRDWVQSLLALAPQCRIFNHYGPTEATVGTLTLPVSAEVLRDSPAYLPIGKPLANCKAYILDCFGNRAPIGVIGELYLGGDCVARGYINRRDLTAQSFVPDPFRKPPDARMYKTGDLARFQRNGTIEFLGRCDHQVKVRGFRIELGEVESTLAKHPDIREAVALAVSNQDAERLVAYFVPATDRTPTSTELRQFLRDKLPNYMIPSAFAPLQSLPRTSHGKFDLRAFPPIDIRENIDNQYVAPRTTPEELIAAIWREVLGVGRVGVHDNFFDLGGHSLLATQVVSRIRDTFQVELALIEIFKSPTVESLAAAVQTSQLKAPQKSIRRRKSLRSNGNHGETPSTASS